MDFLKNEIASKKRVLDRVHDSHSPSPSPSAPPPPKYLKRAELVRIRQEEEDRERKQREQERRAKLYGVKADSAASAGVKRVTPAAAAAAAEEARSSLSPGAASPNKRARTKSPAVESLQASAGTDDASGGPTPGETFFVSNDEAIRRLRQKGHPIRLFGESDKERRLRLRALELIDSDHRSGGQRNDFMRALEGQELGLELEKVAQRSAGTSALSAATGGAAAAGAAVGGASKGKDKSNGSSAVATPEPDAGAGAVVPADGSRSTSKGPNPKDEDVLVDLDLVRTNPHKVYPQIYHAFKRVLKEWEQSLADRPESIKRSTQGKMAAATHATSAEYLKPLFKALRKRELEADVLRNLAEIAHNMQKREYLRANDAYLRLSIGNAPWPIGVTMVGIHERAGRERIFSDNVAHVLNDETSRKYIQSLKRLLTFAQAIRPPSDVSQKMG
ncbi:hypothetical protein JCM8202_004275 [Rhodotorula sphaerocarpa]